MILRMPRLKLGSSMSDHPAFHKPLIGAPCIIPKDDTGRRCPVCMIAAQCVGRLVPAFQDISTDSILPFQGCIPELINQVIDISQRISILECNITERPLQTDTGDSDNIGPGQRQERSFHFYKFLYRIRRIPIRIKFYRAAIDEISFLRCLPDLIKNGCFRDIEDIY